MRAIFLTTLVILLTGCGSAAVIGEEPAPPAPVTDNLASSGPTRPEVDLPEPYAKPGGDRLDSSSENPSSVNSPAEGSALVPLGMTVPLVAWNSEQHAYELQLIDPATGEVFPGRSPIEVGRSAEDPPAVSLSPDGSQLAFVTGVGSACDAYYGCPPAADEVQVIDLPTWSQTTADIAAQFPEAHSPLKGWVNPLVFSPDGEHFALAYHRRDGTTAMLFDARTGQLLGQEPLPIRPRLMEFSADGTELVIYGSPLAEIPWISQPGPPSVLLLDAGSLEFQWSQLLPDILEGSWCLENCGSQSEVTRAAYWWPAVEFSPERQELYIVHADADRLTTVNFQDRAVRSQVIGPRPTWIERLLALTADIAEAKVWPEGASKSAVLSPEGTRLYLVGHTWNRTQNVKGEWQVSETIHGLRVIEVKSGYELDALEAKADWISLSPDRRYVILQTGWRGLTKVLSADSLEPLGQVDGLEFQPSRRLDGEPILIAIRYGPTLYRPSQVSMLAPETFEILSSWSTTGIGFWLTVP